VSPFSDPSYKISSNPVARRNRPTRFRLRLQRGPIEYRGSTGERPPAFAVSNHAMGANGWQLWFLTFHEIPPSTRSDALSRQPSLILFSLDLQGNVSVL
jgi:hypothetical protein